MNGSVVRSYVVSREYKIVSAGGCTIGSGSEYILQPANDLSEVPATTRRVGEPACPRCAH